MGTPTKDEVAERLARAHLELDSGVTHVFRLVSTPDREANPAEPIKLLEVYEHAIPSGVVPVHFPPHPASGLAFSAEIVQIAPEEFDLLRKRELALPDDWTIDCEYLRRDGGRPPS